MVYTLVFRRYAPFDQFGGGFEGDGRTSASTDPKASARTIGVVNFTQTDVGTALGSSTGSTFVGAGAFVERLIGRHFSNVDASVSVKTRTTALISFSARSAGANPLVPGAPKIITIIDFTAKFASTSIELSGTVRGDNFPNAEVIIYDGAGTGLLLWDFQTTGGQTTGPFTRLPALPGGHDDVALGQFNTRVGVNASGAFLGV